MNQKSKWKITPNELDLEKVKLFRHIQAYLKDHPTIKLDPVAGHHWTETSFDLTLHLKPR